MCFVVGGFDVDVGGRSFHLYGLVHSGSESEFYLLQVLSELHINVLALQASTAPVCRVYRYVSDIATAFPRCDAGFLALSDGGCGVVLYAHLLLSRGHSIPRRCCRTHGTNGSSERSYSFS